MSDAKQSKAKRAVPTPRAAAEPIVPALPKPAPMATLPVPMSRRPQGGPDKLVADKFMTACQATLVSIGESQAAVASDVTAMVLAMNGLAHSNLTAAGDSVAALLTAGSLVGAVELQLGFARRGLDAMVGGWTRLGEIGLRLASDAAKPMLGPFAAG